MTRRIGTAFIVLLLFSAPPAQAGTHVFVVLDVSITMRANDQNRLALLATMLLYDLANLNPTLQDSFQVLPFDESWSWTSPADAPPQSRRSPITASFDRRSDFINRIGALRYDARMTYFYPGLRASIEALRQTPSDANDVRTIVLITDGVPERPTRNREAELIREDLLPLIEDSGMRLYVLAFGPEALGNRGFFDALVRGPSGGTLGQVFIDRDGTRLLESMLQIFSTGFGYSRDVARPVPGTDVVDLDAGRTPERVAVVMLSDTPMSEPTLNLRPPTGGALNNPDGLRTGSVVGGSYALRWVLSPNSGDYRLESNVASGTAAVLRPTRLRVEVLPGPSMRQVERTMAQEPTQIRIRVVSPTGASGDPGPVDVSFRPSGDRVRDAETGIVDFRWRGNLGAPPPGQGQPTSDGRYYDALVEFDENRVDPAAVYAGFLEVEARRGGTVVGALSEDRAHRFEVHPRLALAPLPSSYLSDRVLEANERDCIGFEFDVDGHLPHADRPTYALRAVVEASDTGILDRELFQGSLTLDGFTLDVEQRVGPHPGPWYSGRQLTRDELAGQHQLCVIIGRPRSGDPSTPVELSVRFTLLESPYDDFDIVLPFDLKVLVAPPRFLAKWGPTILISLPFLFLALAAWYMRPTPLLPSDLGYAIGREGSGSRVTRRLDPPSFFWRALSIVEERPVIVDGRDRPLAWIRPVNDALYEIRTARDVSFVSVEDRSPVPRNRRGLASIAARNEYLLQVGPTAYRFSVEYL